MCPNNCPFVKSRYFEKEKRMGLGALVHRLRKKASCWALPIRARVSQVLTPLEGSRCRRALSFAALPAGAALVLTALCSLGVPTSDQAPPPAAVSAVGDAKQHFPFAIDPDPIFFEDLPAGKSAQAPLLVRNTQALPLTLNRIETSCSCVGAWPVPIEIGPGESKTLSVTFDSPSEPDFEGGLSVEITGYLADGKVAFRTLAKLEIQPSADGRDE